MALTLLMGQFSAVISDLERDETSNKFLLPPWQSTSRAELTTCLASPLDLPKDNNWLVLGSKRVNLLSKGRGAHEDQQS